MLKHVHIQAERHKKGHTNGGTGKETCRQSDRRGDTGQRAMGRQPRTQTGRETNRQVE